MKILHYRNLHIVWGIIMMMSFNLSSGQDTSVWFEEGATWYYGYGEGMGARTAGYEKLKVTGDTVINSIDYRIINRIRVYSNETIQELENLYLRHDSVNDQVYRHLDSTEYVLYDFSAVKGDTIIVRAISGYGDISFCHLLVDSIGIEVFSDSIQRRVQYCSEILNYQFDFAGNIIEGIGSEVFLFPVDELGCDAGCANHFRCYQDSKINITNPNIECDGLVTGHDSRLPFSEEFTIYPNPISSRSVIEWSNSFQPEKLNVYDLTGRIIYSKSIGNANNSYIDRSDLEKGVLVLEIIDDKGKKYKQQIIVL